MEKEGFIGEGIKPYQKLIGRDYQVIFNLYREVHLFAQRFKYELKPTQVEVQKIIVVALFVKALLTYQSIYVLITNCLTNDAENLLRTLFDSVVRIKYCLKGEEFFERYAHSHNRKILGWLEEAKKHPDEFPPEMQTRGNIIKRIEEVKADLKSAGDPKEIKTWEMAKECGLMKLYNTFYRTASDGVHANLSNLEQFLHIDEKKRVESFQLGPTLSKENIAFPSIFSVELLLIAMGELAIFFGVKTIEEEFSELARRKDECAKKCFSAYEVCPL